MSSANVPSMMSARSDTGYLLFTFVELVGLYLEETTSGLSTLVPGSNER
ncbi:MAG: hypothetical protein Q4Q00_03825 [Turicibacter sp.]|nr:hypothetical protein [Turicibacter sp.]